MLKIYLIENGGHIDLSVAWARSIVSRMGPVRRKATTSRPKLSPAEFEEKNQSYLEAIVGKIRMHDIPQKLVINRIRLE